jgi:hypothetical protein
VYFVFCAMCIYRIQYVLYVNNDCYVLVVRNSRVFIFF